MANTYHLAAQMLGIGSSPFIVHPEQWSRATVAQRGPFFSSLSWYASPKSYPFRQKEIEPLSMLRYTPRTPVFLNLFPYCEPVALDPCLNWPSPQQAKPILWSQNAVLKSKEFVETTPIFNSFSVLPSARISQQCFPDMKGCPTTAVLKTQASSFKNTVVWSPVMAIFIPQVAALHFKFISPPSCGFIPPPTTMGSYGPFPLYFWSNSQTILLLPLHLTIQFNNLHFYEQKGVKGLSFLDQNPSQLSKQRHLGRPHISSCLASSPNFMVLAHLEHLISRSLQMLIRALALMFEIS